jgi:hypothetical protein
VPELLFVGLLVLAVIGLAFLGLWAAGRLGRGQS